MYTLTKKKNKNNLQINYQQARPIKNNASIHMLFEKYCVHKELKEKPSPELLPCTYTATLLRFLYILCILLRSLFCTPALCPYPAHKPCATTLHPYNVRVTSNYISWRKAPEMFLLGKAPEK